MNTARKAKPEGLNRRSTIQKVNTVSRADSDSLRLVCDLPHASLLIQKAVDKAVDDARRRLGIFFRKNEPAVAIPKDFADAFVWDLQDALGIRNIRVVKSRDSIEIMKGDEDESARDDLG